MSVAPSPEAPGLFNWVLVLSLGVIWGAAFMTTAISLEGFGPVTVAALRVAIGAVTLVILAPVFGQPLSAIGAKGWRAVSVVGAVSTALPFLLLAWGIQHVPSAFAGVAMGSLPILLVPLVWLFSPDEGIGPRRIIGLCTGFVGLLILFGPGATESSSDLSAWGRAACLAAAGGYAIGSVVTRNAPPIPPVAFGAGTLVVASAILVPLALILEGWPEAWPLRPTLAVIYVGLMPTGLASVIRVRVVKTAGSLFMSFVNYMVPLWSIAFGIWFLGEDLPPTLFVALAFILAGIAVAQSRALLAMLRR